MGCEKRIVGRREARRIDRRETILAVSRASFLENGYASTTMSGIAAALGGSKATLWSYFPSKEALFEAVLDSATSAFRLEVSTLLHPCGDPERTLRTFCKSYLDKVTMPDAIALHRLVHAEAGRFPEMGAIFYERVPQTIQALLAGFVESAMERGLLRRDDAKRAAKVLTSLSLSGCHQQLLLGRLEAPTPELIAADADAAMEIFLRAYAP
ncbi:TetR/AcrR family transcriptional regulator [Rhizorhabdus argentea]|uniref:TetR/AcrR family transcriptional regulator n=1 Tax=Rhizorhabdus argentea TaxID=1387174 RepID=UPI0030ED517E